MPIPTIFCFLRFFDFCTLHPFKNRMTWQGSGAIYQGKRKGFKSIEAFSGAGNRT